MSWPLRLSAARNALKLNLIISSPMLTSSPIRHLNTHQTVVMLASKTTNDDIYNIPNSKILSNLPVPVKPSLFDSIKEKLGMQGAYRFNQPVMAVAALRLYLCITYQVNYDKFFNKLDLPDVMYSFCIITFLHVWLVSVALMQYGRSGQFVRKVLIKNMWKDIETRAKKLNASMNKESKKNAYENLNDVFRTFLFGFDEGLLSDDTVLAGVIWRNLSEMRELKDYAVLGEMCDYVRKNVQHLENMSEFDLLRDGIVSFVDFDQAKLDHNIAKPKILEIIRKKEQLYQS